MLMRSQRLAATCSKLARASGTSFSRNYYEGPEGTELPPSGHRYPGERLTADWEGEKMHKRHTAMFNRLDKDGNGFLNLDEIVYKASVEICGNIDASPEQTKKHTAAVIAFFGPGGLGMDFGVETEVEDFCKKWENLTKDELDRWAKKDDTLIFNWAKALFDIIDKSDDNAIDIDEWDYYQRAAQVCDTREDCVATFEVCDQNGDGKIELEEMTRQHIGFWYTGEVDGLYGKSVP